MCNQSTPAYNEANGERHEKSTIQIVKILKAVEGSRLAKEGYFCAGSMHTRLSKRYWNEICKALRHLESEYSGICFDTLKQEADPFDVFSTMNE